LRGLAHEVKNPLGGLRGAAQLLERELPDPALREYTQVIIGEADRLQQLVDNILGPNRIPDRTLVNVHEILEHVRKLVAAEAGTDITLLTDYDPSIPEGYMDRNQIVQAVLNIVRNAVQAVGTQGEVILRTRTESHVLIGDVTHKLVALIEVIDNGSGIPPDMLEQIFYPMVTTRASGSGLGLSISQSIISHHGGLIRCQSSPGVTTFRISLPIQEQLTPIHRDGGVYE